MSKRVLLDECMHRNSSVLFAEYETGDAKDPKLGLNGKKDCEVYQKAAEKDHGGFDVVVTSEKRIHRHIGDEKKYAVGIVVMRLPDGLEPTLENLAPLASKTKEAIEQVGKGEMLHVHPSGQIEKVTYKQLCERDKNQKAGKEERGDEKKKELATWQEQRPEGISVKDWSREFGKRKREEYRQNMTEKGIKRRAGKELEQDRERSR